MSETNGSVGDPYTVPTAATSVVAGIGLAAEIVATADDKVAFRPLVHVALAAAGVGNVALGTASAFYNRDREPHNYLLGPILAGVTGLPLIVLSVYNLVADSPAAPNGSMMSCNAGRCRAGIPVPQVMMDLRGAPAPGLQLVEARF